LRGDGFNDLVHVAGEEAGKQSDEPKKETLGGDGGRVAIVGVAAADFANCRSLIGALVALILAQNVAQFVARASNYGTERHLGTVVNVARATLFGKIVANSTVAVPFSRHHGSKAESSANRQHDSVHVFCFY